MPKSYLQLKITPPRRGLFYKVASDNRVIKGKGQAVEGDLVVTTLSTLTPALMPMISQFQHDHPDIQLRLITSNRVLRLEYGEAHVALRAGSPPSEPDNIVRKLTKLDFGLYASQSYVDVWGKLKSIADYPNHRFIGFEGQTGDPAMLWMERAIPKEMIAFRATDALVNQQAIKAGIGLGFMSCAAAAADPTLIPLETPDMDGDVTLWAVTHMDLHRTAKVQAFLGAVKDYFSA